MTEGRRVRVKNPSKEEIESINYAFTDIVTCIDELINTYGDYLKGIEKDRLNVVAEKVDAVSTSCKARFDAISEKMAEKELLESVKKFTPEELKELIALKEAKENGN